MYRKSWFTFVSSLFLRCPLDWGKKTLVSGPRNCVPFGSVQKGKQIQILGERLSGTKFCFLWMEVFLEKRFPKGEVTLYSSILSHILLCDSKNRGIAPAKRNLMTLYALTELFVEASATGLFACLLANKISPYLGWVCCSASYPEPFPSLWTTFPKRRNQIWRYFSYQDQKETIDTL